MEEWPLKWFDLKLNNKSYVEWALLEGLYNAVCNSCGHEWAVYRAAASDAWAFYHVCPQCSEPTYIVARDKSEHSGYQFAQDPHGFEVEAMPTRTYYPLAVNALLDVVPFGHIVSNLRDECTAQEYDAAQVVLDEVLEENEDYQGLLSEFDRLNAIKSKFESDGLRRLRDLATPHIGDWRNLEDDPEPADFQGYVTEARRGASPWRPFSRVLRTKRLTNRVKYAGQGVVAQLKGQDIDWGQNVAA